MYELEFQTAVKWAFKHLLKHLIEKKFFARWEKLFHNLEPLNLIVN